MRTVQTLVEMRSIWTDATAHQVATYVRLGELAETVIADFVSNVRAGRCRAAVATARRLIAVELGISVGTVRRFSKARLLSAIVPAPLSFRVLRTLFPLVEPDTAHPGGFRVCETARGLLAGLETIPLRELPARVAAVRRRPARPRTLGATRLAMGLLERLRTQPAAADVFRALGTALVFVEFNAIRSGFEDGRGFDVFSGSFEGETLDQSGLHRHAVTPPAARCERCKRSSRPVLSLFGFLLCAECATRKEDDH